MSTTYVVAFYELDRCYGGSEEGGWWYNTGSLVRTFKTVKNEDEAFRLAMRANHLLDLIQTGYKKDIYSMGYAGGKYQAEVYEDKAPEYYPKERPYYE